MIGRADTEDALLDALATLHADQGGPLRTLQAGSAYSVEEAMQAAPTRPAPACTVLATEADTTPLRPGLRHDVTHTITLLLTARSYRGRQAAARGDTDQVGVYDLLAATKQALLGRSILGAGASEMQPGREWLLSGNQTLCTWCQEWKITIYC